MSELVRDLSLRVRLPEAEVRNVIVTAPYRYKVYQIPKRSGAGSRTIAQPAAEVKVLQRVVVTSHLQNWPIHRCAVAYRKGYSVLQHVRAHTASKFLLKMDFKDFFPSISLSNVESHIRQHSAFEDDDVRLLGLLLTYRDRSSGRRSLSIGAPSSPLVSNSILWNFDCAVSDFCLARHISYTRYADDLAFSTGAPGVLREVEEFVRLQTREVDYPRLVVNEQKTANVSSRFARRLVGLTLTPDGGVSVGRDRKRLLRAQLHRITQGDLEGVDLTAVSGQIAYFWSVEPEFVERLQRRYFEVFAKLGLSFGRVQPQQKAA